MHFWSKGLGNRTISLRLDDGEAVKSGDRLYVRGRTEEPVSWDYVMPLTGSDLVEFVALLRDPAVAEFMYRSKRRWRLYARLTIGGLRFLVLMLVEIGRRRLGPPPPQEPEIVIPPPSERGSRRTSTRTARRGIEAGADEVSTG